MEQDFHQMYQADPVQALLSTALFFLFYLVIGVGPACGILYILYFMLTLPLRRNERARMFLDVLELGLGRGRTPEAAISQVALSHDRSFGVRFYLLAEHLAAGHRLSEALAKVPRLLPRQITAMLSVGERIGDITKTLPACRQFLKDGVSQVRGGLNYVILLVFALTPAIVVFPLILRANVLPAFTALFEGARIPAFTAFVFTEYGTFALIQIAIVAFLWLGLLVYIGGPRFSRWVDRILPGLPDSLALKFPWRLKRVQRDFSIMLSVLLDAGVPEPEALDLAAQATGNSSFQKRASKARAALGAGQKLPEALAALDRHGEFRWRLENAAHSRGGFLRALSGWHEALDAKAFQLEQSAAQVTTTSLVLLNGFLVGCMVIGVFLALIGLISNNTPW